MLYASATHPPTSRDLEPYWQVGEWRKPLPPPTHLPVGKTPLVGVLPYYSVGRTQLPLSHKLTPSSLPPYSMFMTEVTSMGGATCISYKFDHQMAPLRLPQS